MKEYLVLYVNGYQETVTAEDVSDAFSRCTDGGGYEVKLILLLDKTDGPFFH